MMTLYSSPDVSVQLHIYPPHKLQFLFLIPSRGAGKGKQKNLRQFGYIGPSFCMRSECDEHVL